MLLESITFGLLLAAPQASLEERLEAAMEEAWATSARDLERLSVTVLLGDEVVLERSLGGTGEFGALPLLETFTATALLAAERAGELDVEDPVSEHLAAFESSGSEVTLRNLLAHTSGLAHFADLPEELATATEGTDVLVRALASAPRAAEPDACFAWSNADVVLAELVLTRATGVPLFEHLAGALFEPLSMDDTGPCRPREDAVSEPCPELGGELDRDLTGPVHLGSQCLCTTAADVAAFVRALTTGRLIGEEGFERMIEPQVLADGSQAPSGLGVRLVELADSPGMTFGGAAGEQRAHVSWYRDLDLTVVLFAEGDAPLAQLARRLARAAYDLEGPGLRDLPLAEADVLACAGTYLYGCTELVVRAEGERLVLDIGGQDRVTLIHQGDRVFLAEEDDELRVAFEGDGELAHTLVLERHGSTSRARRTGQDRSGR
jgi:CubicO group peptidase (beta-lactamase class C family)